MEDIRLTKNFSVLHCSAGEAKQLPVDQRAQFDQLYQLVFAKSSAFVDWMIDYHMRMPGESHYFFGTENGVIVAFTYFARFKNRSGFTYALSCGSISHPGSMGSFLPLFEYANKYMGSCTDLLMGFCNRKSVKIYTHPVFGWLRDPEFRQLKLTGLLFAGPSTTVLNRGKNQSIHSIPLQSTLFRRDEEFLNWRLSRIRNFEILKNDVSGHISIIKPFENEFDVVTILNCKTREEYRDELRLIFDHLRMMKPGFSGLNVYLSYPGTDDLINSSFTSEPLAHERFLCYRPSMGFTPSAHAFVEMIDSDTI